MRISSLAKIVIGVEDVVVEGASFDETRQALVIDARPRAPQACVCGRCGRRAPYHDAGRGTRLWRCCDVGGARAYVRCEAFRVRCPECGATVRRVPWADHGSRFTRAFEDTCCWLALSMSKRACQELMRVSWRTVGAICSRVLARLEEGAPPRTAGLRRIGVDETSYRKGRRYMTVVVNHDTGAVVWCHDGCGRRVFDAFLEGIGEEGRASIELVSADGARWVDDAMREWVPRATRCVDTFHVVQWATDLLDEVRRQAWRDANARAKAAPRRRGGRPRKGEVANPERRCVWSSSACGFHHGNFRIPARKSFGFRHGHAGRRPYLPDLPSMRLSSSLWLGPPNSMSLPWCTTLSTIAAASLSSAKTVPHFENSTFVVKMTLLLS